MEQRRIVARVRGRGLIVTVFDEAAANLLGTLSQCVWTDFVEQIGIGPMSGPVEWQDISIDMRIKGRADEATTARILKATDMGFKSVRYSFSQGGKHVNGYALVSQTSGLVALQNQGDPDFT